MFRPGVGGSDGTAAGCSQCRRVDEQRTSRRTRHRQGADVSSPSPSSSSVLQLKLPTCSGSRRPTHNNEYVEEPSTVVAGCPTTSPSPTQPPPLLSDLPRTTDDRPGLSDLSPTDRLHAGPCDPPSLVDVVRAVPTVQRTDGLGLGHVGVSPAGLSLPQTADGLRVPPSTPGGRLKAASSCGKDRLSCSSSLSSLRAAVTAAGGGVTCKRCGGCRCESCQRAVLLCTRRRATADLCRCGADTGRRSSAGLTDCVVPCLCACWLWTVSSCVRRCTARPHACRCLTLAESL